VRDLVYTKWRPEDLDAVLAKARQYQSESIKFPEKYPESLLPPQQILGKSIGVNIFEGTENQIISLTLFYLPEVTLNVVPLCELSKTIKLWQDTQKERPEKYTA
jgi:hypothetical protein